jgi:flagellar hook-length control protein FliK
VIVMQPSVSLAQQLPTASSSMPRASTPLVGGKLPSATTAFGDALGKLLAAVAANQPTLPADAATEIAQATDDPSASVPTPQPGQTPPGPPVVYALPLPQTAIRAQSDTGTAKAPPESQPVRRDRPMRATSVSVPVDQQVLPADVHQLTVATPPADSTPENAAPTATRQDAEAPEQMEAVKTAPWPPPQDAEAGTPAQSAALPPLPAALPETATQSTPSNLAAAMSPSQAASPAAQLAPALVQMGPAPETATRAPSDTLEHAALATPRQHAEAPEQTDAVKAAPSPQTDGAPTAPTAVSVDATSSQPPHDAQAAALAQSVALPVGELKPSVPAALPEAATQSTPSKLATAISPSPAPSPAAPLAPAAFAPLPPETAVRAPSDAGTSKAPPESQPVRRGTYPRATSVSVSVDQQALPTDAQPLPATPPLHASTPEHAAPEAPRQYVEAPEQNEAVKAASSAQATSVLVDATPSLPPQAAEAAAPAQSAAPPVVELKPWVPAALPETAAQSTPSNLATAISPSPAASLSAQVAPAASARLLPETAIRAPSDAGTSKAPQPLPVATPLPRSTPENAAPASPRQHAEAPEQKEAVKATPSPQTVDAAARPASLPVDATSSMPPQDTQAATHAQSAALPAVELTPQMTAALPETVALSTPSSLITDAASPSHAASPAAQLAPALVQMGHAPDGAQRLTVRLDPPELGLVQVRIDRPAEAAARVEITVEKPETLTLLLRNQPQLQHALDLAGVPAEGRSVTFHVASPEPSRNSEPATAPAPGVAAGGLSGDGSHGAPRQGGQSGRQQTSAQDGSETEFTPIGPTGWLRGGLDITA